MVTLSKTINILSDGSVLTRTPTSEYIRLDANLVVPQSGTFVQLKHWSDFPDKVDNVKEFPEMFNNSMGLELRDPSGRDYDYVEMPDPWQRFLWDWWDNRSQYKLPRGKIERFYQKPGNFRTFAEATPGSLTYVYVNMVEAHRAFTEAGSPEAGNEDVVTGRNIGAKGYEWLCFPTGGAMVKVLRTLGTYYEIEALDLLKPPPTVEYLEARPWLHFWCTQYSRSTGSTRFPQIKNANEVHGLPPAGISSPLLSLGGKIRVRKSSTTPLTNGQVWTPYK